MATGSSRRYEQMIEVLRSLTQSKDLSHHIKLHKISPEREVSVDESSNPDPGLVSLEKVLAIAFALGLIDSEEIGTFLLNEWSDICKICPEEKGIPIEEDIVLYGGDVITSVSTEYGNNDLYLELLKLTRSLTGDAESDAIIIQEDKAKIISIYTNGDGFFVRYKVGIALLSNDHSRSSAAITTSCEIVMKLKPLPFEMIEDAYAEGGEAYQVGPRLDLAMLSEDYLDDSFGIFISQASDEKKIWYPIDIEIMKGFVLGGICPPHAFLKMLYEVIDLEHTSGKEIESTSIQLKLESFVS
jgi:hypothetical protein